jgi:hypothetical protein
MNAVTRKLFEMLQGDSSDRRRAAALVIGELGIREPRVLKALATMAESPDRAVQDVAMEALAGIKSPRRSVSSSRCSRRRDSRRTEDRRGFAAAGLAPGDAAVKDPARSLRRRRRSGSSRGPVGLRRPASRNSLDRDPIARMAGGDPSRARYPPTAGAGGAPAESRRCSAG